MMSNKRLETLTDLCDNDVDNNNLVIIRKENKKNPLKKPYRIDDSILNIMIS